MAPNLRIHKPIVTLLPPNVSYYSNILDYIIFSTLPNILNMY